MDDFLVRDSLPPTSPRNGSDATRIPLAVALLSVAVLLVLLDKRDQLSAAHFVRAVQEGVAYSLQDTFTLFAELGIPVTAIRLGGGGARGDLWRRIQAGVYGKTVEVLTAEEGGAFGCALMAGVGVGHWKNLDEACAQAIHVAERIEPDPKDVAAYQAGYANWRKLYPALRGLRN